MTINIIRMGAAVFYEICGERESASNKFEQVTIELSNVRDEKAMGCAFVDF